MQLMGDHFRIREPPLYDDSFENGSCIFFCTSTNLISNWLQKEPQYEHVRAITSKNYENQLY